jgi:hypothetical protein
MKAKLYNLLVWPEDPAWPDRAGNDPYDIKHGNK